VVSKGNTGASTSPRCGRAETHKPHTPARESYTQGAGDPRKRRPEDTATSETHATTARSPLGQRSFLAYGCQLSCILCVFPLMLMGECGCANFERREGVPVPMPMLL
jgi:hypothetical protein